ncbi:L,D-transpeptidase catalytic domain [Spirosomataceae bacterium TFI 002]|nr:L,D-transpeptidase catalytic domain [Spirosomataceae bacterium TFI 002]
MKRLILLFICFPFLVNGQWGIEAKANDLAQLASLHDISINIPVSLDSAKLEKLAYEFIQKYHFGEKPKNLTFNGLDNSKGKQICSTWVNEFMNMPLTKALPIQSRPIGELENFKLWKQQFDITNYVLVNIASNELTAFENDSIALKMKVIVGTRKNKTPVMATYADAVMLYPYWTPTANIIHNEIIPKVKKDMSYLSRNNFEVLNNKGQLVDPTDLDWNSFNRKNFPYKIRQGTGCDNSLGLLKINIQNPHSIYMHDTPHTTYNKGLFDREKRFFSHGCIRLEKPLELANWLDPKTTIDQGLMDKCLLNQKPEVVFLKQKVPVFLMYFTEYYDENGEYVELDDVYGLQE